MPISAVLLIDLQRDFLDLEKGRMPVDEWGAKAVLRVANEVLSKRILADALPIFVVNQFPSTARLGNFFRKGAAILGSAGAALDGRLERSGSEEVISKASPSAFSNPELERCLRAHDIQDIYVLGVFAEGCVRSTAVDAVKHGYTVHVIADAVASTAAWKKAFALWAMARAGVEILPSVISPGGGQRCSPQRMAAEMQLESKGKCNCLTRCCRRPASPLRGCAAHEPQIGRPMSCRIAELTTVSFALLGLFAGCAWVPPTVENDPSLEFVELENYKFHVRTVGDKQLPPVIVVHGGPGGDSKYLYPIQDLLRNHHVIFYDQRGTGLSPRVNKESLTLQSSLDDLHSIVIHYGGTGQVKLIGHSWGAMLVVGYLGKHPDRVSHAVVVEPGILHPVSAVAFVRRFKASQSIWDALPLVKYILLTPFVSNLDGHERFDYVMTRLMNRAKPGGPYQCEGEAMPPNAFERAGYAAFDNMLKPVLDHPESFSQDLTNGVAAYKGKLLMLSSECSFIGYKYQQEFHMPSMPTQTVHVQAVGMGHNMLTLNPAWSVAVIDNFFSGAAARGQ